MIVLDALNAVLDWMNSIGVNDEAAITLLIFTSSAIWAKASDAWKKRKASKQN